ncbi:MAG: hypothetical protein GY928_09240 [Colwellia sp.]|nr:hypothetical protein [Colwellia sp.]
MDKEKCIKTLDRISKDMRKDANYFDGRIFNGANIAEYNGKQGAAISAIADILQKLLKDETRKIPN